MLKKRVKCEYINVFILLFERLLKKIVNNVEMRYNYKIIEIIYNLINTTLKKYLNNIC